MIHDPSVFDTVDYDSRVVDLGPYELDDVERVTIRRGRPAQPVAYSLTGEEIGKLACAGAFTGTAIAFVIDPAGAAAALLPIVGW